MRAVVRRRPRVLGRRRAVPRVVLPAPLPPAQGERLRGDAQGGGEPAGARGRGLRHRAVLRAAPQGLGPAGETADVQGGTGKSAIVLSDRCVRRLEGVDPPRRHS